VEMAMLWLDEIKQRDGVERWLELVETLRTVTEGKVRRVVCPRMWRAASRTHIPNPFPIHSALFGNTTGPRDALTCTPP